MRPNPYAVCRFVLLPALSLFGLAAVDDGPVTEHVRLPGTTVEFTMIKVPAPSGGKAFWIGRTEVTWDEYDAFSNDTGYEELPKGEEPALGAIARPSRPYGERYRGFGKEGRPVLGVHERAAAIYCRWLSDKTKRKYRLPTEAEWSWAARAGARDVKADLEEVAWYRKNAGGKPHPVARKTPNAWGFHDMLGNLAEWAYDAEGRAVTCGGSFVDKAEDVGPGARRYYDPAWQDADAQFPKSVFWLSDGVHVGFRVLRDDQD